MTIAQTTHEVGDIFKVTNDSHYAVPKGSVVMLAKQPSLDDPLFEMVTGTPRMPFVNNDGTTHIHLGNLEKLEPIGGGLDTPRSKGFDTGDRFMYFKYDGIAVFENGSIIELDPAGDELYKLVDGQCMFNNASDGGPGAHVYSSSVYSLESIQGEPKMNEDVKYLMDKADHLEVLAESIEQIAKDLRNDREEVLEQIKAQLPEGWEINKSSKVQSAGSTDWRDWNLGDHVTCISDENDDFNEGDVLEVVEKEESSYTGGLPALLRNVDTDHTVWPLMDPREEPQFRAM